jgi:hypothetical protein
MISGWLSWSLIASVFTNSAARHIVLQRAGPAGTKKPAKPEAAQPVSRFAPPRAWATTSARGFVASEREPILGPWAPGVKQGMKRADTAPRLWPGVLLLDGGTPNGRPKVGRGPASVKPRCRPPAGLCRAAEGGSTSSRYPVGSQPGKNTPSIGCYSVPASRRASCAPRPSVTPTVLPLSRRSTRALQCPRTRCRASWDTNPKPWSEGSTLTLRDPAPIRSGGVPGRAAPRTARRPTAAARFGQTF